MIIIFIKIMVRPEKRKELSQTLDSIIERVNKEGGCMDAGFYQDAGNENNFLVVEKWATQKDSDRHIRSDIFMVMVGAGSLMHRPPEIMIHTVSELTTLEV